MSRPFRGFLLWVSAIASGVAPAAAQDVAPLGEGVPAFKVRPGYRVTVAATPGLIEEARFLELDDGGTLYLSEKSKGKVLALRDTDNDRVFDAVTVFLDNRPKVHGLDYHDGWLWFGTPTTIGKARDTNGDGMADEVVMILENLQGDRGHDWRPVLVTDDGYLLTAIGDPGNINDERETDRQKIWRYKLDGSDKTLFASGLRNTEEFAYRPGTQDLYGADHGSDWFGREAGDKQGMQPITDFHPPDELNRYVEGGFYGHPFITAPRIPRYEYLKKEGVDIVDLAAKTTPPEWLFGAHWATNGFAFVSNENQEFPEDHHGDLFQACHGSWNRSQRGGYRVERVLFDDLTGRPYGSLFVVDCLSEDGKQVLARPVDVLEDTDGTLLFTSDAPRPMLYRIEWVGQ